MASTIGGDDADHDLDAEEKDKEEKKMREEALELLRKNKKKERTKKLNRANEIWHGSKPGNTVQCEITFSDRSQLLTE